MGVLQVGETRASGTADIPRARYDNLGSIKVEVWRKKIISKDGSLDQYESRLGEVIPEKEVKGRALTLVTRSLTWLKKISFAADAETALTNPRLLRIAEQSGEREPMAIQLQCLSSSIAPMVCLR